MTNDIPPMRPENFRRATADAVWLAGSTADTAERNLARAYLALREEIWRLQDEMMK
jgi:hypothetical protein